MEPIKRPEITCPIPGCGYVADGNLDLHLHQQKDHSMEEVERHRLETEDRVLEANHALVREDEDPDKWLEFGG